MKRIFTLLTLALFMAGRTFSQCTPDVQGCPDVGEPGEICPDVLPDGTLNQPYSQSITILAPDSALYLGIMVPLVQVQLVSIENLPAGLSYQANEPTNIFLSGNYYCVLLSGIPTETGLFPLKISVKPTVLVFGFPFEVPTPVVDSTSVSIEVVEGSNAIRLVPSAFGWTTDPLNQPILLAPASESVTLAISNPMGQQLYCGRMATQPGENTLPPALSGLPRGMYLLTVSNGRERLSTRWFKTY